MKEKVTKNTVEYPKHQRPNLIVTSECDTCRYIIGKKGINPLVAICMNPSAAGDDKSDSTINRVISISKKLQYDGWIVFNTYPERATNAANLGEYNEDLSRNNLKYLRDFIIKNEIKEIWGAWGDLKHEALVKGKEDIVSLLRSLNVDIFYFGTLTVAGNPRHPIQRKESWERINYRKKYLDLQNL